MMNNKEYLTMQDIVVQLGQIDYLEILETIRPLIIFYLTNRALKAYSLHKSYKPKKISSVLLPEELTTKYNEVDIKKLAAKEFGEYVVKFAEFAVKTFPKEDLTNFYNNINDLKTRSKNNSVRKAFFDKGLVGVYKNKKNEITIFNGKKIETTIYHELFHMASSIFKDGKKISGFHQTSWKGDIGKGINEGYTEFLTQRYFTHDITTAGAYYYHVLIAEKLEQIVGQEKMQSLYLNANLKGLIDELKQYASEEEVMRFISDTDFLISHMHDNESHSHVRKMIEKCYKRINRFLIICYSRKLQHQYNNYAPFSSDELIEKLAKFVSKLPNTISSGKYVYQAMTDEEFGESLRASLIKPNDKNQEETKDIKK